jgi:hypothetical protein
VTPGCATPPPVSIFSSFVSFPFLCTELTAAVCELLHVRGTRDEPTGCYHTPCQKTAARISSDQRATHHLLVQRQSELRRASGCISCSQDGGVVVVPQQGLRTQTSESHVHWPQRYGCGPVGTREAACAASGAKDGQGDGHTHSAGKVLGGGRQPSVCTNNKGHRRQLLGLAPARAPSMKHVFYCPAAMQCLLRICNALQAGADVCARVRLRHF